MPSPTSYFYYFYPRDGYLRRGKSVAGGGTTLTGTASAFFSASMRASVAGLGARALDGLVDVVAGEHAERDRELALRRQRADAGRRFAHHQVEVRRRAADDRAQADDAVELAGVGDLARQARDLHRARAAVELDVLRLYARPAHRCARPVDQLFDDEVVEARRDDGEAPVFPGQAPLVQRTFVLRTVRRRLGLWSAHDDPFTPAPASRRATTRPGGWIGTHSTTSRP